MKETSRLKRLLFTTSYLILVLLTVLIILSLTRFGLLLVAHNLMLPSNLSNYALQAKAFLIGLQFDYAICCYVSALPLLVTIISTFFETSGKSVLKFCKNWMLGLYNIVIILQIVNIPYFLYFSKNLNASIWTWLSDFDVVAGMILGEPFYYLFLAIIIILVLLFSLVTISLYKFTRKRLSSICGKSNKKALSGTILSGLLLLALCFLGIRGKEIKPLNVGFAYYCTDPFLNQLGANATYNLAFSTRGILNPSTKELHLMDDGEALLKAQSLLNRKTFMNYTYEPDTLKKEKKNVVLILMESMTTGLMQTFGQKECLTPFLDSLYHQSLAFKNCYSAGLHTNNGIFSTLTSVPSLMYGNLMRNDAEPPLYQSLPSALKQHGYKTMFFITHESHFDNLNTFLYNHSIDELYEEKDYPEDERLTRFGPPDETLFRLGLEKMDKTKEPFMTTLLTITNHPPFKFPDTFKGKAKTQELRAVEYADYCLQNFFKEAEKKAWYKNTIFVLVADHGKSLGYSECEIPADFNHIPLLFFQPEKEGKEIEGWALQIDIQPTLLHLLGLEAEQNNFGIDLLKEERPYAFYSADDKIAIRDDKHLLIYEPGTKKEFLYHVTDTKNLKRSEPDATFAKMRDYLFCMFQTAQIAVKKGGTAATQY